VRIPLKQILVSPTMWLTSLSQFGTNVGWVFLVTWLPRYLEEVHKAPIEMRGWMAAIPLGCGIGGMMLGGVLTDAMVRMCGLRWGRALPMGLTRFLATAAFLVCLLPLEDWCGTWTPWVVTAAFSTVAFATDLGVPAVWAFCQDVGGRHVGSVLGWGNMWGNIGAAISPLLLNELVSDANWDLAFLACAIAFLISGIAALGVDATRPIVPEDQP
jgi:nitrate/nitrite transporter NarK